MTTPRAEWKTFREERGWEAWIKATPWHHWLYFALVLVLIAGLAYERSVRRETGFLVPWLIQSSLAAVFAYNTSNVHRFGRPNRQLAQKLRFYLPTTRSRVAPLMMTVLKDNEPIGQDQGVVEFRDGMLQYRGLRTEFDLKPSDTFILDEDWAHGVIDDEKPRQWWFGNRQDESAWGFFLTDDATYRVFFFPIKANGFADIYPLLYKWITESPEAQGETRLPPATPLPGYKPPVFPSPKRSVRALLKR